METSITLVQNPIIKHNLELIGKSITKKISELNLKNQVATEDTVKTLKKIRAELNKELKEYESQRKSIKDAVMNPYLDFEKIFKEQITDKFKDADDTLKDTINSFELSVKTEKRKSLKTYFEEICKVEKIDWLSFDSLNLDINLSTTEKKYKEQIIEKVNSVIDDLKLINTEEYSAEMLVEYKKTLKASQAIQTVRERKKAEKIEEEQIKIRVFQQRQSQLISIGFNFDDITQTFRLNDSVISVKEIETLSNEEWVKTYALFKNLIEIPDEPLKAPVAETKETVKTTEPIYNAKFIVKGTYDELKKLGDFLKSNNYNYKNIK